MLHHIAERIKFIERGGGFRSIPARILILLRKLAEGIVLAAGVDKAAVRIRLSLCHHLTEVGRNRLRENRGVISRLHHLTGIVAAGIIDIVELPLPRAVEMRHAAIAVAGGDECRPGGSIC